MTISFGFAKNHNIIWNNNMVIIGKKHSNKIMSKLFLEKIWKCFNQHFSPTTCQTGHQKGINFYWRNFVWNFFWRNFFLFETFGDEIWGWDLSLVRWTQRFWRLNDWRIHFNLLSFCLSFYLSICLSVCLSVCLSICLSVCLSVCLSICLVVGLYVSHSAYYKLIINDFFLYVSLSLCLFVSLSLCLSIFLEFVRIILFLPSFAEYNFFLFNSIPVKLILHFPTTIIFPLLTCYLSNDLKYEVFHTKSRIE
jgi:hypothetical protein